MPYADDTTICMFTSSIPSHPSTAMIEQVLSSIRFWFPQSQIMIMADGLRPEFAGRFQQYAEYLDALDAKIDNRTVIRKFANHCHQTTMLINTLPSISTPLILFSEHDIELLTDRPIDWQMMADAIRGGQCDLCRLMLTENVHPVHEYLYRGQLGDLPLRPQKQYSGWTHLASADWYRRLLTGFDTRAKMTVERYVARLIEPRPWEENRLTSYIPDPQQAKRIHHLDGRADPTRDNGNGRDPSFEEQEVYPPR